MNLWKNIETGRNVPKEINAVVEIPKGSRNKYEYNEKEGYFYLDRVISAVLSYAGDYGLIPRTKGEDGDPLDVLVLVEQPTFTGCVLVVRPIGVIRMEDEKGIDDKIIAVLVHDAHNERVKDIKNLPKQTSRELAQFFSEYKKLEGKGKFARVKGIEGRKTAEELILKAMKAYSKKCKR
ncbi:MAG: inorganic diphosphatase [Candidatus Micrarchaeota archaeon]